MRLPFVVALLLLPGCLQIDDGGASSDACRSGTGPLFLKVKGGAGFVPSWFIPDYWSIDRDGDLFQFSGEFAHSSSDMGQGLTGSGRIDARHGKLHNITTAQVKEELQRLGVWRSDRDWNVTVAYRTWIGERAFGSWCGRAVDDVYGAASSPSRTNCADDPWFRVDVSTERGVHWVTASTARSCDNAPERVHAFFDDFRGFAQAKEEAIVGKPS